MVLILASMFYLYRKKIIKKMKDAEKKLYGVIDHSELVYGKLLGSGGFGEVCVFKKNYSFK